VRYELLGPLRVLRTVDGRDQPVDIGPPKQRAVLAVLLLAGGAVVSTDRLIDAVWGDDVPGSATASLQAYISNLRKALRSDGAVASPIVRQAPGYLLQADDVDLTVFTRSAVSAREAITAGDWAAALAAAQAALSQWRGPLLEDFADQPWVGVAAGRVDELRLECLEHKVTALLAVGRVPEALADAADLRAADPLRDRACWLHMLTLYRAGRGADALDVYTSHAKNLEAELGLDPGPELRALQTAILQQSPELAAWPRQPAWTGAVDVSSPAASVASADVSAEASPATTLVGRERETEAIARLITDVRSGSTRWLLLTGPAGIGKTRLAEEAVATMSASGGRAVWISCPDERGAPPWWPMRQLVRALGADADTVLAIPPDADPETARFLVYERIQLLLSVTDALAVVIDDAQWADSTSLSALAYIAGALRDRPVAVVVTVRDGERTPALDRLLAAVARGDGNRRITVPALSAGAVATLANDIAEDRLTDAEAALLAERTGGNPFFVSEYARLPREERSADIPSAIRSVLDRRLGSLDAAVLQVLRAAAVIGDVLDGPGIALLAEVTRLDFDTLADYLDEAADNHILVAAHGRAGYEFTHGLLREHLLAGLAPLRRQRLHATIAVLLADRLSAGSDTAPELASRRAQHLVAAAPLVEPQEIVDGCRLAAEYAAAQWSSDIAARWWQAALDAYDTLPAAARVDADRDALTVALLQALARAGRGQTVLDAASIAITDALRAGRTATAGRVAGELLRVSGGWPWLAPATDPGELLALLQRAADFAVDDPAAGARLRAALAVGHCYNPDPAISAQQLAIADELAAAAGDPDVMADVLMGRLITYSGVSRYSRETLQWVDALNALPHSRSREDAVIAHSLATMAALNLADVDGAARHVRKGIEGSEELRLPVVRAQLRWMQAVLALWRGDFAEAESHHGTAAYVHGQTELYMAGSGLIAEACLLREQGGPVDSTSLFGRLMQDDPEGMVAVAQAALVVLRDDDDAGRHAAQLLARPRDGENVWTALGNDALLAELCARHGLTDYAPGLLERLLPHRDEIAIIGQVGVVAPVALATAWLYALLGRRDAARSDLAHARDIAERTGGVPALLRCRLLAAELDAADGTDVRAVAQALAADAERAGMVGVAAAARALS